MAAGDVSGGFEATAALDRLERARAQYGNAVTPMVMELPASVHEVFAAVQAAGFRPLVVGGSVRDALNDGRAPKDVDVEVYGASIDETAATLTAAGYRVDEVGKAFGVLKVTLADGLDLDVSVPRRDNHVGAGHRGFTVETDVEMTAEEAAARRDFTINAMGFDPEFGVCVDPYDGRSDLASGTLRHTSEAFAEDPLRVLRGFQFAARYDMTLDEGTAGLCRSLVPRAGELPVERVRGEWAKFYAKGAHPDRGLQVLQETGWDATVPGLAEVNSARTRAYAAKAVAIATRDGLSSEERTRLVAATIARQVAAQDRTSFVRSTLEGGDMQRQALGLAEARWSGEVSDAAVRRWAHELQAARTNVREWSRVETVAGNGAVAARVLERAETLGCESAPQPDLVLGRDIVARFPDRRPGPWTGEVQRAARQAQIDGVFNTVEGARAWLTSLT